jgi:hypothetical protein
VEPARFDWYAATVETSPETLVEVAGTLLADESPVLVRGKNGYARGYELRSGGKRAAVVYAGGVNEWPHIVGTGPDAVDVARLVRGDVMKATPHRVARADVCVDTDTPGAFDFLVLALRAAAGSATRITWLPDRLEDGTTYYVGAKASEVTGRLYEKGKQLASEDRPDWVRYEVQVRPQKERKAWCAVASAEEVLGAARWARRFAEDTLGVAAPAPPVRSERVSDLEGAIATMCHQYGKRLLELLEVHQGDIERFALDLLSRAQGDDTAA